MTLHDPTHAVTGTIVVACVQMQPAFGDVAANVAHSLDLIDQAAARGARLVVLPELANTGYMFASREEAFRLAEAIPAGTTVAAPTVVTNERLVTLSMMASTCCVPNILHWIATLTFTRMLSHD